MHAYHQTLPHNAGTPFITDAGLETELVFKKGYELPQFAAFPLLETEQGKTDLREYYEHYIAIARKYNTGIVLEAPTWRASSAWGEKLGYDTEALARINQEAIRFLGSLKDDAGLQTPCTISGCIGPRYDGYAPENSLSSEQAEAYHSAQIKALSDAGADVVSAFTMTSISEANGIVRAAKKHKVPVVISFTTETDGHLPSGESLQQAVEFIDQQSDAYPLYYMINCAHPTHFEQAIKDKQAWIRRIGGIRANASCKSHAELDESTELDAGNPQQLGVEYKALKSKLTNLHVVGGCCGTNHQHIAAIAQACFA